MKTKEKLLYLVCVCVLVLASSNKALASQNNNKQAIIDFLQSTFKKPDSEIDLAQVKLSIDKFIDPSINTKNTMKAITKIENDFKAGVVPKMKPLDKALSLSAFLYERGRWNNGHPFLYDFADPFGTKIENKLLSNYLKTKKGNCISMPMLHVILADRLNLDVTLSTAPLHVFVKVKDSVSNEYVNLEITDKGRIVSNQFYQNKTTISEKAIQNGLYFQPLTKKQSVAVMAVLLSEYYSHKEKWQDSINIAKLILQYYPKYAYAMIKIGNGYSKLLAQKVAEARTKGSYTKDEKAIMDNLYRKNIYWFEKAEKLGWLPPSEQENEKYLNSVKKRAK